MDNPNLLYFILIKTGDGGLGCYEGRKFTSSTVNSFSCYFGDICGGIYNEDSSLTLINCIFSDNFVGASIPQTDNCYAYGGMGGGMYNLNSNLTLDSCVFIGNEANHGSGMYNENSSLVINKYTFSGQ